MTSVNRRQLWESVLIHTIIPCFISAGFISCFLHLTSLLYLHTCTASPLLALFLVIVPAPSLFLEFLHSLISPVFLHLTSSPHYFSLYFSPVFNSVFMELSVVCFPVHLVLFPYSCRCVSLFLSCFSAPE